MTSSGEPNSGARGVSEPDWIDQILERATNHVDGASPSHSNNASKREAMPIVPDEPDRTAGPSTSTSPTPREGTNASAAGSAGSVPADKPSNASGATTTSAGTSSPGPRRRPTAADDLAEIRWADPTDVTPAATPIASPAAQGEPAGAQRPTGVADGLGADFLGTARPVNSDGTSTAAMAASAGSTPPGAGLTPDAVGRSAWDADLAAIDDRAPEGWDKLSWTDLDGTDDGGSPGRAREIEEPTSFGRLLREWGPVLIAAIAIALFTRLVLVQAYHIPSASMEPTLENGDRVVVNRLSYQFGEIERGQVVVFEKPPGTTSENDLIKRVIGLPGETIRFVDEQVYINGLRVEEPYLAQQNSTRPRSGAIPGCAQSTPLPDQCVIPEGHVFVMGDNRLGSQDSRVFGPIDTESIVGRAFVRVWPLNNLGQL